MFTKIHSSIICQSYFSLTSQMVAKYFNRIPKFHLNDCLMRSLIPHSGSLIKIVNKRAKYKTYSTSPTSRGETIPRFSNVNDYTTRTHHCGELNVSHEGTNVRLCGWVQYVRMGKFIVIRDAYGTVQIICDKLGTPLPSNVHLESVVEVTGTVVRRPVSQINDKMGTGAIEVVANSVRIVSAAMASPPFQIRESNKAIMKTLNRHRYLALRFPEFQHILRLRSEVIFKMRQFLLTRKQFVEVETPTLFKKTPGGAQEFVVPTQKKNKFYSLIQSPQQLKQLLMVGSVDRYFQVARCYRDETTEADRQPEFTQLDIELSFTTVDGVIRLTEDVLAHSWPSHKNRIKPPFPRMNYQEAMNKYGSDKPCFLDKFLVQNLNWYVQDNSDRYSYMIVVPDGKSLYKKLKFYVDVSLQNRSSEVYIFKVSNREKLFEDLRKINLDFDTEKLEQQFAVEDGDLVILAKGSEKLKTLETLGLCRRKAIEEMNIIQDMNEKGQYEILWVVDFPLFEKTGTGHIKSVHHPFTQPHPEGVQFLSKDFLKAKSLAYDLVINGSEIAGGSIRIHDVEMQKTILRLLKLQENDFSHLLDALQMGCPPHGGIALGLDRLIAILCNRKSIKDVIAFPKGNEGHDLMTDCPCDVSIEDKIRYHL